MKKILDILSNMLLTISGILFLFIFIINVAGIICRTFLNFSLLWVTDASNISIAWMLALSMSAAIYKKIHLTIEIIRNKFPQKVKKVLEIVLTLIIIAFFINLIFSGWKTGIMKMSIDFTVLGIPTGYAFMALPVFAFFSAIFMTNRLVNILLSK
ncbi:MAG: TRAP transporter small permease subunit, partial [Candidatus Atribacteria bacterium]|nr:TRAP transporter small permease subunit [Candidatus Atribacteria bacterium]